MSSVRSYITRRAIFPDDRSIVIDLWRGSLGDLVRCTNKFEWFYKNSAAGEPLTILLSWTLTETNLDAEPAGVAAAGPRSFLIGEHAATAGLLVDMTVLAKHRTLFPALVLQRTVLEQGLTAYPMLYGFPNSKAAPVFQKVGYRKLGMIVRYVRVLRSARYLKKRLPAVLAVAGGTFGDLFMWLRFGMSGRYGNDLDLHWLDLGETHVSPQFDLAPVATNLIRGARDASFIRWRFSKNDNRKCNFISVNRREDGAQQGWWVVESFNDVLRICDCSAELMRGPHAILSWKKLATSARLRGFCSLSFELFGPKQFVATLRKAGLTPRSERPVFGAVREDHEERVRSAEWFLTAADEDE